MGRQFRPSKPLIYVFCEGESEEAYTEFLKQRFGQDAVIKYFKNVDVFSDAESKFRNNNRLKEAIEVINEIWFFFDAEQSEKDKWDGRYRIIKALRQIRKGSKIRIRLLMTKGCVEYWFMLHFRKMRPSLLTAADKDNMMKMLQREIPEYRKGDQISIFKIAENYPKAVESADELFHELLEDGMPQIEDTDERNRWLYRSSLSFTTVHEAIRFLEELNAA